MPELPEVEVTRRGLATQLVGRRVRSVMTRVPALRYPLPAQLGRTLVGQQLSGIDRRGKYLLFEFGNGHLLVHLGMSGSLRLVAPDLPAQKHDHVDIVFDDRVLRFHDPRRFGAMLWIAGDPARHPLLASLGMEPLSRQFNADSLAAALEGRRTAVKPAIMDANIVVGVGNIYASESLYRAGIDPRTPAGRISRPRLVRLVPAIKSTLRSAIRAGGSSLRDYVQSDGRLGDFQQRHRVYGRADEPCRICGTIIRALRQGNRATYYCPHCQH
jgi:formamidopyrimidine-DNA glycosylase